MPWMPILHRDGVWKTFLSLSQQKQDSAAALFKAHISWVELQVKRRALGDGVVPVPQWYWIMETHVCRTARL